MARKTTSPKTGFRWTPQHVPLDAAKLVTIDDPRVAKWENGLSGSILLPAKGAFVRLRPPSGVTPAAVEVARKDCLAHGALAVRVIAPNTASVVVEPVTREPSPGSGIREVVMAMAKESNCVDREALVGALETHLSTAGL